jgi:hypothetical protein
MHLLKRIVLAFEQFAPSLHDAVFPWRDARDTMDRSNGMI